MIAMTPTMRSLIDNALPDGRPCLVGTADENGRPQISPKGSVALFDDETLSYWERSFRGAYRHLGKNPQVVVYYRNPDRAEEVGVLGAALRFHGTARIVEEGPDRDRAYEIMVQAEKDRDPDKKGVAVLIKVDRIEALSGEAVMERD